MSAAMSKRHKPRRDIPGGPLTRFQMKSGRYEETVHGDPDRPMFEEDRKGKLVQVGFHERAGIRAIAHYTTMTLTETQREAADRLCVQVERAAGAIWRPEGVVVALHPSQRGHPAEWQVAAISDLRQARAALGAAAWGVAWACVVENRRISAQASGGQARAVLTGRLLAALDRLGEHWRMG